MSSPRRKEFPPGTFIPTPQRLMAIGQLCIALSLLFWYAIQPFMGEYFSLRSRMLLYEYVMGTSDLLKKDDQREKLERQAKRFQFLPENQKNLILKDYQQIQEYAQRSTFQKIIDGLQVLFLKIPPFEQAWIFFSITIAILVLLKKEGAKSAIWLLPLIVIAYSFDNQMTGKTLTSPDLKIFPTEKMIIENYLTEPFADSPFKQKEQLEKGWKYYLIDQWSINQEQEQGQQLEEAEFQFTLARLNLLHAQPHSEWLNAFHEKLSLFTLLLFFIWNVLFAWLVNHQYISSQFFRRKIESMN